MKMYILERDKMSFDDQDERIFLLVKSKYLNRWQSRKQDLHWKIHAYNSLLLIPGNDNSCLESTVWLLILLLSHISFLLKVNVCLVLNSFLSLLTASRILDLSMTLFILYCFTFSSS